MQCNSCGAKLMPLHQQSHRYSHMRVLALTHSSCLLLRWRQLAAGYSQVFGAVRHIRILRNGQVRTDEYATAHPPKHLWPALCHSQFAGRSRSQTHPEEPRQAQSGINRDGTLAHDNFFGDPLLGNPHGLQKFFQQDVPGSGVRHFTHNATSSQW